MKRILILTALFIFACSDDDGSDTNDNNNNDNNKLVSRIVTSVLFEGEELQIDASYNYYYNTNRILNITDNLSGNIEVNFLYDDNGKIVETSSPNGNYRTFDYDDTGKLISTNFYYGGYDHISTFTYNENGTVTQSSQSTPNSDGSTITFELDLNGNINLNGSMIYDNKNYPFKNIEGLHWYFSPLFNYPLPFGYANNLLSHSYNGNEQIATYTYNDFNYPTFITSSNWFDRENINVEITYLD